MIDNPVRGRFNAWFLAAFDSYMHWKYADKPLVLSTMFVAIRHQITATCIK
jgi:hypothetical protein